MYCKVMIIIIITATGSKAEVRKSLSARSQLSGKGRLSFVQTKLLNSSTLALDVIQVLGIFESSYLYCVL